jgi:hypothetical protein
MKTILSWAALLFLLIWIYRTIRKNKRRPFFLAGEKFEEAFIDEVQDLSQGKGDAFECLKSAFPGHEKAYLQFRTFLKGRTLQRFDESWQVYYCYSKENPRPYPEQYFAAGNIELAKEKRALALRRIGRLLSFARNR